MCSIFLFFERLWRFIEILDGLRWFPRFILGGLRHSNLVKNIRVRRLFSRIKDFRFKRTCAFFSISILSGKLFQRFHGAIRSFVYLRGFEFLVFIIASTGTQGHNFLSLKKLVLELKCRLLSSQGILLASVFWKRWMLPGEIVFCRNAHFSWMRHLIKLLHLIVRWSFLPVIPRLFGHPARINFRPILLNLTHEIFLDNRGNTRLRLLYLDLFGDAYQRFVSTHRLELHGFLRITTWRNLAPRVSVLAIAANCSVGRYFSIPVVCLAYIFSCKTKFVEILIFEALSHLRSLHLLSSLWALLRLVKIQLLRILALSGEQAAVIFLGVHGIDQG